MWSAVSEYCLQGDAKEPFWKYYKIFRLLSLQPRHWQLGLHYDHSLSIVRPSSLTFHIFDFSSETAERNFTKLYRKLDLNVIHQVCVFRADRKNKMAALASDWLRHFQLLWNRWMDYGIQRNVTGSKISTSSTKFVFFGPIGKTRWPSWSLIGWDIFNLSSETAEQNSTKHDRKQ